MNLKRNTFDFWPILSIHSGCPGNTGNEISARNFSITERLTGGVPYYIRLAGDSTSPPTTGNYELVVRKSFALDSNALQVAVNSTGQFTIGVDGDPNDTENHLLYGHPSPGTGGITLRVDGQNYANNFFDASQQDLSVISAPQTIGAVNTVVLGAGNIQLTQNLEIVEGSTTGVFDSLRMEYVITNNDNVSHQVGFRNFLDTWLGSTDGAPFRVPGIG